MPHQNVFQVSLSQRLFMVAFGLIAACKAENPAFKDKKILEFAIESKVASLDPIHAATSYDHWGTAPVYDTLLQYNYLERPSRLEPNLVTKLPTISEDGLTYSFELKPGILFHDDPCFAGGSGRELIAEDVIFSIKRMANLTLRPKGWWIYNDRIVGFDTYKDRQRNRPAGAPFNYDESVEGLRVTGRYTFDLVLKRPYPQLLSVLAMPYTSIVAREATEAYPEDFHRHAVGTGPFILDRWSAGTELVYSKNPKYRPELYPGATFAELGDEEAGLLRNAGAKLPLLDGIVIHIIDASQPRWLKFRVGDLHFTTVPTEFHDAVFTDDSQLRPNFQAQNISMYKVALLDFIYRGFNMNDPIYGGVQGKPIRQAISMAIDHAEFNDAFYNNTAIVYDGPIPPGLSGHPNNPISPYRGPRLSLAKALLKKAGYPDGKGLPPLYYETAIGGNLREQSEMLTRQLAEIGITLQTTFNHFPELSDKLHRNKAQFFGIAWNSDYPDAENNLAMFYGPNAGGMNHFHYQNPTYDALYRRASTMIDSPTRTRLYEDMRDIIIEDVPAIGALARTRIYLWNPTLKSMKPSETWYGWLKYLDVERR